MDEKIARIIFDSISDGVFTVDEQCIITSFNKAAEHITGFAAEQAVGKHCFDVFRTEICHKQCALRVTLSNHVPVKDARVTTITQEGCEVPIKVSTTLLRDDDGKTIGAVEFFSDLTEVEHLRNRLDQSRVLESIVSASPQMRSIIDMLPHIAESECSVLVTGPSGSGKELIAQAIHSFSARRYGPYIKLNCAALPGTLLESELFGYVKGAFTDAKRDKPGHFCLADGGTLLLDEIGEMDISLQVKLLRESRFNRIGLPPPRRDFRKEATGRVRRQIHFPCRPRGSGFASSAQAQQPGSVDCLPCRTRTKRICTPVLAWRKAGRADKLSEESAKQVTITYG